MPLAEQVVRLRVAHGFCRAPPLVDQSFVEGGELV
jgi:hypothetical protein